MHLLDVVTILCAGLLVGNELTVSLFINPVIRQLEEQARTKTVSLFAALLGKAMPVWYALCFLLLLVEAYLRRHQPGHYLLLAAAGIWAAVILFSIFFLVPINNRIARLSQEAVPDWHTQHKTWDTLHRWRILSLIVAMVCLLQGILSLC